MNFDNLVLAYCVKELNDLLKEGVIRNVQFLDKNVFKLKVYSAKGGTQNLLILPQAVFLSNYKIEAKQYASGYHNFLKKRISGKKILGIRQYLFERIITIELEDYNIVIEIFGEGNIVLCDKENNILMPLHREKWKDRIIKKNTKYAFPPSKHNIIGLSNEEFSSIFENSDSNAFKTIIRNVNIAPIYVEDQFKSLNLNLKETMKLTNKEKISILNGLKEYYSISNEKKCPYITSHLEKEHLTPIKLTNFSEVKKFESINEAIDAIISPKILGTKEAVISSAYEKEKKSLDNQLKIQLEAKEKFEKEIISAQKRGDLLYEHFHLLETIIEELKKIPKNENKNEKTIMNKVKIAEKNGLIPKGLIKSINLSRKKLIIEIK